MIHINKWARWELLKYKGLEGLAMPHSTVQRTPAERRGLLALQSFSLESAARSNTVAVTHDTQVRRSCIFSISEHSSLGEAPITAPSGNQQYSF